MGNYDTITGYDFTVDPPLGRTKSVREHCKGCRPEHNPWTCKMDTCELHKWRSQQCKPQIDSSRAKDVHKYCLACQGGDRNGPGKCDITDCTLWPYRTSRSLTACNKRKLKD